jgi:hypothetical protein
MFEEELANPVEGEEKETLPIPPIEEKTDDEEKGSQPEEKAEEVPYHKDPRWMEMYSKSKKVDEVEEELAELRAWREQQESSKPAETQPIPDWFRKLYGDDTEVWKAYQESTKSEKEAWKKEFFEELESRETEKVESIKRGEEWIADQLADLKDQGHTFDENELVKVVVDNQLFDKEGNPNFKAGLRFLEADKTEPMNPKKRIASMTAGKGSEPGTSSVTSEDLRHTSWNELID